MPKNFEDYLRKEEEPITPIVSKGKSFNDYINKEYSEIPYESEGRLEGLTPGEVDYSESYKKVADSDWWNDLKSSWDGVQLSAYKYNKAKAQLAIDLNDKRIEELNKELKYNIGNPNDKLDEIKKLRLENLDNQNSLLKANEGIGVNEKEIENEPVSEIFKMKQALTNAKGSDADFIDVLKYTTSNGIGSMGSMMAETALATFGRQAFIKAAQFGLTAAGVGIETGPGAIAVGALATLGQMSTSAHARWAETKSEVGEHIEQAEKALTEKWMKEHPDQEPTEEDLREIRIKSMKGVDQLFWQQMALAVPDMAQAMIGSSLFKGSSIFSGLNKIGNYSRGTRIAKTAGLVYGNMAEEKIEEGYQYATQKRALDKVLEKDTQDGLFSKILTDYWDTASSINLNLPYASNINLGGKYAEDKQFQAAAEAGGLLGMIGGGIARVAKTTSELSKFYSVAKELKDKSVINLDAKMFKLKDQIYFKHFENDTTEYLLEGLRGLNKNYDDKGQKLLSDNQLIEEVKNITDAYAKYNEVVRFSENITKKGALGMSYSKDQQVMINKYKSELFNVSIQLTRDNKNLKDLDIENVKLKLNLNPDSKNSYLNKSIDTQKLIIDDIKSESSNLANEFIKSEVNNRLKIAEDKLKSLEKERELFLAEIKETGFKLNDKNLSPEDSNIIEDALRQELNIAESQEKYNELLKIKDNKTLESWYNKKLENAIEIEELNKKNNPVVEEESEEVAPVEANNEPFESTDEEDELETNRIHAENLIHLYELKQRAAKQKELEEVLNNATNLSDLSEYEQVKYAGMQGTISKHPEENVYIFKDDKTGREYDIPQSEEFGYDGKLHDYGIFELPKENPVTDLIEISNDGIVTIDGKTYKNNYSNPLLAINRDKNGNILSVTLSTLDGKPRTFKKYADELAYVILLHTYNKLENENSRTRKETKQRLTEKTTKQDSERKESNITPRDSEESRKIEEAIANLEKGIKESKDLLNKSLAEEEQETLYQQAIKSKTSGELLTYLGKFKGHKYTSELNKLYKELIEKEKTVISTPNKPVNTNVVQLNKNDEEEFDETEEATPDTVVEEDEELSDIDNQLYPNVKEQKSLTYKPNKLREQLHVATKGELLSSAEVNDLIIKEGANINNLITIDAVEFKGKKSVRVKVGDKVLGYFQDAKYNSPELNQLIAGINVGDKLSNAQIKTLGFNLNISDGYVKLSNTPIAMSELNDVAKTNNDYIIFDQGSNKFRAEGNSPILIRDANGAINAGDIEIPYNQRRLGRYILVFTEPVSGKKKYVPIYPAKIKDYKLYIKNLIELANKIIKGDESGKFTDQQISDFNTKLNDDVFIAVKNNELEGRNINVEFNIDKYGNLRVNIVEASYDSKIPDNPIYKLTIKNSELSQFKDENDLLTYINDLTTSNAGVSINADSFRQSVPTGELTGSNKSVGNMFQTYTAQEVLEGQDVIISVNKLDATANTITPKAKPVSISSLLDDGDIKETTSKEIDEFDVDTNTAPKKDDDGETPVFKLGNITLNENDVNYSFKSLVNIHNNLPKVNQWWKQIGNTDVFWNKLQKDLQIPKEQIDLLKESDGKTIGDKLISFSTQYSYTVEIETAKGGNKDLTIQETEFKGEKRWSIVDSYTTIPLKSFKSEKEANDYLINELQKPTYHYSNLTVPGGTNYTENEIKTPDIIPSIKGHAQFATDKGIGWFRSDEQLVNQRERKQDPTEDDFFNENNLFIGGENTKTRRILEVQSDLFQKGRDKKDLINNLVEADETGFLDFNNVDEDGIPEFIDNEEIEFYSKDSKNSFLQLLNKDNNWVTFFIKSIIQDSAKKGYEKVLFPRLDTIIQIESKGKFKTYEEAEKYYKTHEWIVKNDKAKKELDNKRQELKNFKSKKLSEIEEEYKQEYIDKIEREISEAYENWHSLQPTLLNTANFYEYELANRLDDIAGGNKNNRAKGIWALNQITDEYGNKWNEVTINDKIKKEIETIVFKLIDNKIDNIIDSNEISEVERIVPEEIPVQVRKDIKSLVKNVAKNKTPWGFFKNKIIYLWDEAGSGTGYHEAFHAIFRYAISDKEVDIYLKLAEKEVLKKLNTKEKAEKAINELRNSSTDYINLSDKQLYYILLEEHIADRFMEWKKNKDLNTSVGLKQLFKRLFNLIKELVRINDSLESLFDKIDRGAFHSTKIVPNKQSLITQIVHKNLISGVDTHMSSTKSKKIINTFAARVKKESRKPENSSLSLDEILEKLIQERIINLETKGKEYIKSITEPILKAKLLQAWKEEIYLLKNKEAKELLVEQVNKRLKLFDNRVVDGIEEDENDEGENNDKGGEDGFGSKEAWTISLEEGTNKVIKEYIAFAMYETIDELTNEPTLVSVDNQTIYNGLGHVLANTPEDQIMNRFITYAKDNEQAKAVLDMIMDDTGMSYNEKGLLSDAKKNFNDLRKIITAFKNVKVTFLHTGFKSAFNEAGKIVGVNVTVGNANTNTADKISISEWSNNLFNIKNKNQTDKKFWETKINNIVNTFKRNRNNIITEEELNKQIKEVQNAFKAVGIKLSSGYLRYSILSYKEQFKSLSEEQLNDITPFKDDIKPLDLLSIYGEPSGYSLGNYLANNKDPYEEGKEGMGGRMKEIAAANGVFDESLASSNFKGADGNTRYDIIKSSYVLDEAIRLRNKGYRDSIIKKYEILKDNLLLKNDTFLNKLVINLIDGVRDQSKSDNEGKSFGDFSEREYLMQHIGYWFAQTDKGNANFLFRQNEASNTAYVAEMPINKYTSNNIISDDAVNTIYNFFKAEYNRIARESAKGLGNIKGYNDKETGRAFRFTEFANLVYTIGPAKYNQITENAKVNEPLSDELVNDVKKAIRKSLENQIKEFKKLLAENKLITLENGKAKPSSILPNRLKGKVLEGLEFDSTLAEMYLNDYINSFSLNQLFDGDYALSRDDKGVKEIEIDGIKVLVPKQDLGVDIVKRNKGAMGSGSNLGTGNHRVAFIKDINVFVNGKKDGQLIRVNSDLKLETAAEVYSKLGNKTKNENIIIKSVYQQEGIQYAKSINGIFSLRVNNSNKHFGNPFSSVKSEIDKGLIATTSTKESVEKYINWVINSQDERAIWIREQLKSGDLKGKPIIYYKELGEPSHATALDYLINNYNWSNKKSDKINSNDAQSYTNINHIMFMTERFGRMSDDIRSILRKIRRGVDITKKQQEKLESAGVSLNPWKTVTFGREFYIKTSEALISRHEVSYITDKDKYNELMDELEFMEDTKELTKEALIEFNKELITLYKPIPGKEYYHTMLNQMDLHGIDQIVAESASKGMTLTPVDSLADNMDLSLAMIDIPNSYKRLQVETPTGKEVITAGTQLMQLIDSEQNDVVEVIINGKTLTIGEVRKQYRDAMSKTRNNSFKLAEAYIRKNADGTTDTSNLKKKFLKSLESAGADDQLLEIFELNWNLLPAIDKAEQLFLAHFGGGVLAQKVPGTKVSLMSDAHWNVIRDENGKVILNKTVKAKPEKYKVDPNNSKLKHNVRDSKTGQLYSECILSERVFSKFGLNIGDEIPVEVATMLGYRIPTQDKHSMISLRVVDILPNYLEGTGIFPAEIVLLSGADFDIDSLFIQQPAFWMNNGKAVKSGTETSREERWTSFLNYILNNKIFDTQFQIALNNSKEYKELSSIKKKKKEESERLKTLKTEIRNQTLAYFKLPVNESEFNKLYINGIVVNNNTLNNDVLDTQLALLTNKAMEDIALQPVTSDPLVEEAKYIESLKEGSSKTNNSASSLLGKAKAFFQNSAGKAGIGPVANALQAFTFLAKNNISRTGDTSLIINDKELSKFDYTNEEGGRVADTLSTVLSVMTDNAKDPIAGKMGLTLEILTAYNYLISLGVPLRTATLIINTPSIQMYAKLLKENKYSLKTDAEKKGTSNEKLATLFSEIKGETVDISDVSDMRKNVKPINTESLEQVIKEGLNDTNRELNLDLLITFLQIESESKYFGDLNNLIKLTKGLPTSFTDVDKGMIDSLYKLGLNKEYGLPERNLDKEITPPFDVREAVKNDNLLNENINLALQIMNYAKDVFITETKQFKEEFNKLILNLKSTLSKDDYKEIKRSFLGFISTKAYVKYMQQYNADFKAANDNLLFPQLGGETLAKELIKLKNSSNESISNNAFIRWLKPELNISVEDKSSTIFDKVSGKSFIKLSTESINDIVNSFHDLLENPQTKQFAINSFHYLISKDNLEYKNDSFVKYLAPKVFNSVSKGLNLEMKNLMLGMNSSEFEENANEFKLLLATGIPTQSYLKQVKLPATVKVGEEIVNNEFKDQMSFNFGTSRGLFDSRTKGETIEYKYPEYILIRIGKKTNLYYNDLQGKKEDWSGFVTYKKLPSFGFKSISLFGKDYFSNYETYSKLDQLKKEDKKGVEEKNKEDDEFYDKILINSKDALATKIPKEQNKPSNNLDNSEKSSILPNMNIMFEEEQSSGYRERTIKNASADATIAIAVDFNTAGEKLTKSSVLQQGKLYLPVSTDIFASSNDVSMMAGKIVSELRKLNKDSISLNIAGNGIYSLKNTFPGGQSSVDKFTFELLSEIVNKLTKENIKVNLIRTGGQTGFDEAGAKAGIKLGIPTKILAPKGWTFRDINSKDISNEQQFKQRFGVNINNQLDLFNNLPKGLTEEDINNLPDC